MAVEVWCAHTGLATITSKIQRSNKAKLFTANGLVDIKPNQSFFLKVANFGKRDAVITPKQVIAYASTPTSIYPLSKSNANSKSNWEEQVALSHLSASDKESVLRLLQKHASMWSGNLGELKGTVHHIDTGENPAVHLAPYRAGPAARESTKAEVNRML
jgi:hypothetical protein